MRSRTAAVQGIGLGIDAGTLHGTRPDVHVHEPPWQTVPPAQTVPQLPQLRGSLVVTTPPEHGIWPAGHVQVPSTHDWPPRHSALQAPQCAALLDRSTQLLAH